MPPKTAKRGAAAVGTRRTPRATRGTAKAQNQYRPETTEESLKVDEISVPVVEAKEVVKVEEKLIVAEEKPVIEKKHVIVDQQASDLKEEVKLDPNGLKSK